MKVDTAIKTEDGIVKFQGELSQQEADMVIQLGLNYLLVRGAIVAKMAGVSDDSGPEQEDETLQ